MSRLEDWLVKAAVELGVRIETDRALQLSGGRHVIAEAFFPDLGTKTGMAVVSDVHPPEAVEELHRLGHAACVLSEPTEGEEFDLEGYAEMFAEWGSSNENRDRPAWMAALDT